MMRVVPRMIAARFHRMKHTAYATGAFVVGSRRRYHPGPDDR